MSRHIKHIRWILIIALVSLAIWRLAPHVTNLSNLLALKRNADPAWFAAALISQTGLYLADGWLSQILLKIINFKMNLKDTVRIAAINVLAARFSPVGETGALVTMFYFYRKLGVKTEGVIFLSLAWGLISIFVLVMIFVVSFLLIPQVPLPFHFSSRNLILFAILVTPIIALFVERNRLIPKLKKILQKYSWSAHIVKFTKNWHIYKHLIFQNHLLTVQAFAASVLYHFANITTLAFCFLVFGMPQSIVVFAFAYTVSQVSGWITFSPGGIGSADAVLILLFLKFGASPTQTVAAVLLYRLITSTLPIPAALFSYLSLRKKLK